MACVFTFALRRTDTVLVTICHINASYTIFLQRKEPLIVSGGDDGVIKVWDLRQFKKYVLFKYYRCIVAVLLEFSRKFWTFKHLSSEQRKDRVLLCRVLL